jgi:hypothetical protein
VQVVLAQAVAAADNVVVLAFELAVPVIVMVQSETFRVAALALLAVIGVRLAGPDGLIGVGVLRDRADREVSDWAVISVAVRPTSTGILQGQHAVLGLPTELKDHRTLASSHSCSLWRGNMVPGRS